jgi:hypothetical protein
VSKDDILVGSILFLIFAAGVTIGIMVGFTWGEKHGYTAALDDARLGKPAKYKLVQAAEKWVEVER